MTLSPLWKVFEIIIQFMGIVYNILGWLGVVDFSTAFGKIGINADKNFITVFTFCFTFYFSSVVVFYVTKQYMKNKKINLKSVRERWSIIWSTSFYVWITFYLLWFFSSKSELRLISQAFIILIISIGGWILLSLFIGLLFILFEKEWR